MDAAPANLLRGLREIKDSYNMSWRHRTVLAWLTAKLVKEIRDAGIQSFKAKLVEEIRNDGIRNALPNNDPPPTNYGLHGRPTFRPPNCS